MNPLFLFLTFMFVASDAFLWKDCGSSLGSIAGISLEGCKDPSAKICQVKKGTSIDAQVTVNVHDGVADITSASSVIHAVIGGVAIPWTPPNPHACSSGGGLDCPVKASTSTTYSLGVDIKSYYPSVRANIKWEVKDDTTGADLFCFMAPVIVSS